MELLVLLIGGVLAFAASTWYYAALGKRITDEEKEAGRDLTYEINPFTGSAKDTKDENIAHYNINSRNLY